MIKKINRDSGLELAMHSIKNKFSLLKRLLILLILLFGFNPILKSDKVKFYFEGITNEKGLTHNTVYDICQDAKGFMWFSTEGGLNRYDGQNIKQYYPSKKTNSLPSATIPCLINTPDNKLFVGTTKGLALYEPETDEFSTVLNKTKPIGDIIAMQLGDKFEILICTYDNGALRYNYKQNSFSTLKLSKDRILGMTIDKEGMYWAYSRLELIRFNKHNKIIARYNVSSKLFNSAISYIKSDSKGNLLIGTFENGLYTYNFTSQTFTHFVSRNGETMYYVRTIEEGVNPNEYWIGTEKGLYIIDIKTGYFSHYTQSFDYNQKSINDNAIYKIYRNKQNVFYIATYFGGVNIARMRQTGFNAIYPDDKSGSLQGKALNSIVKASDGKLWIATEDAGIAIFDKKKNSFKHLKAIDNNPNTISTNNVHALLMDHNTCWAGHFMGGISKIDINSGRAKRFRSIINNPNSLSDNFVFSLHPYSADSILIGTVTGVNLFDKKTEKFYRFRENELYDCFVHNIFTDPYGKVWICTINKGIFILDKKKRGLMDHYHANDKSGLPTNTIISHYVDSKNRIWIGTKGAGLCLYNPKTKTFKTWNSEKLLIDDVVYGIEEDNKGKIWISSNRGISCLNFTNNTSIHFNFKHGIAGNQYNYKSNFKDDDGTIYFGSITGLTWFKPETILMSYEAPTLYFTNLYIFNKLILPDSLGVLKKGLDYTKELKLKHNQNSFTLEFASINYLKDEIAYQYYLEGLEKSWSPLTEIMQANYTNITPGKYRFHIRAINKIGNVVGEERNIIIKVLPPFWASWKAYLLYLIVTGCVAYILFKNNQIRQKEKVALTIERIEKENLDILHQHKMNFFTYISHEFKTPLTIIIASVEMLFQRGIPQDEETNDIQHTIKRSATRLLYLVNQLMEFRRIETDHADILVSKGNVIDFANQIIGIYKPLLTKKSIKLNMKVSYTVLEIYFDFDKLEKILTNLITNAVKYTPQNGTIEFCLNVDIEQLSFSVENSGKGFSEAQIDKIFEVFYSEDSSTDLVESSGIGLSLTAGLVKLLKGEINVESQPEKGCKFLVKLPCMIASDTANAYNNPFSVSELSDISDMHNNITEKTVSSNKEFTLVIAEDNTDLLMLIHKRFKDKYSVKCFENGKDAWEYVCIKTPDIIITDIMMPIMSGNELCSKIKTDANLCHIPVIMLTAKTTIEDKLDGLKSGADIYIFKPFSIEELDIQVNNIINNKVVLKKKLIELARIEGLNIPETNHELAFMEKILLLINNNLNKCELDVQFIADNLNMSRSSLHNKVKLLMNMNTSEFINTVRLNKAKELIYNNTLTLSEISFKVGYSDTAYFTRIFKKTTGKTPGEYRKEICSKKDC